MYGYENFSDADIRLIRGELAATFEDGYAKMVEDELKFNNIVGIEADFHRRAPILTIPRANRSRKSKAKTTGTKKTSAMEILNGVRWNDRHLQHITSFLNIKERFFLSPLLDIRQLEQGKIVLVENKLNESLTSWKFRKFHGFYERDRAGSIQHIEAPRMEGPNGFETKMNEYVRRYYENPRLRRPMHTETSSVFKNKFMDTITLFDYSFGDTDKEFYAREEDYILIYEMMVFLEFVSESNHLFIPVIVLNGDGFPIRTMYNGFTTFPREPTIISLRRKLRHTNPVPYIIYAQGLPFPGAPYPYYP